jgi:hypothetical protein
MGYYYGKGKKDKNHKAVAEQFTVRGYYVLDVSALKCGFDFIAWKHGKVFVVEVKDGTKPSSQTKLTPKEIIASQFYADYHVIFSAKHAGILLDNQKG